MIVIAGKATIKVEKLEEAIREAQQMSQTTEAEEGCISYRFYVKPTENNTFFIFEEWENAEALTNHFQAPHFQNFGAYLSSILQGKMEIKRYEVSAVTPL